MKVADVCRDLATSAELQLAEWSSSVRVGKRPGLVWCVLSFSCFLAKKTWYPWLQNPLELYRLWETDKLSNIISFEVWQTSNFVELPEHTRTVSRETKNTEFISFVKTSEERIIPWDLGRNCDSQLIAGALRLLGVCYLIVKFRRPFLAWIVIAQISVMKLLIFPGFVGLAFPQGAKRLSP